MTVSSPYEKRREGFSKIFVQKIIDHIIWNEIINKKKKYLIKFIIIFCKVKGFIITMVIFIFENLFNWFLKFKN